MTTEQKLTDLQKTIAEKKEEREQARKDATIVSPTHLFRDMKTPMEHYRDATGYASNGKVSRVDGYINDFHAFPHRLVSWLFPSGASINSGLQDLQAYIKWFDAMSAKLKYLEKDVKARTKHENKVRELDRELAVLSTECNTLSSQLANMTPEQFEMEQLKMRLTELEKQASKK